MAGEASQEKASIHTELRRRWVKVTPPLAQACFRDLCCSSRNARGLVVYFFNIYLEKHHVSHFSSI